MKLNLQMLRTPPKEEAVTKTEPPHRTPDGTLRMDCRGCNRRPEPSSSECIRCISSAISRCGRSERILLRSHNDIQISGPGAEILCSLSPMFPDIPGTPGRCKGCECSPNALLAPIWDSFPETVFDGSRKVLARCPPKDDQCRVCMQRSRMVLDSAEAAYIRTACAAAETAGGRT